MNATLRTVALLGALMLAAALAACADGGDGGDGAGDPTATPAMRIEPAPIESVEITVAESFPQQYFAGIVSGLPNGCVKFHSLETVRAGDTIRITVLNAVPGPEMMCTMVYGMLPHNVALGSDFESGRTYTVEVNDVTETFVAQ